MAPISIYNNSLDTPKESMKEKDPSSQSIDFLDLYQRYCEQIYRYHFIRTGNIQDAQDLTSQTFIAALEGQRKYRGDGSISAWLFGIAYHKVMDYFRNQKEIACGENGSFTHKIVFTDPDYEDKAAIEERLEKQSWLSLIVQALNSLSSDRAEAIRLRFYAGFTIAEISKIMNKSEDAVKMLVLRGIKDLRLLLSIHLQEDK